MGAARWAWMLTVWGGFQTRPYMNSIRTRPDDPLPRCMRPDSSRTSRKWQTGGVGMSAMAPLWGPSGRDADIAKATLMTRIGL
jgi:hypothetical protein